jgi:hypothetical protein
LYVADNLKANMSGLNGIVPPGVVTGDNLLKLMTYCRDNQVPIGRISVSAETVTDIFLSLIK